MKTYLECIPCFFNQIVRTGRLLGMDDAAIMEMYGEFGTTLKKIRVDVPPPQTAIALYDMISRHSGLADPFYALKQESTKAALAMLDELEEKAKGSDNPLSTAIRFAIAGNIIDFGISTEFNLEDELEKVLDSASYGIWLEDELTHAVHDAPWILYLGDNTGETVFDRLLIKTLERPVTYAVRGGPIINDVTMEDALTAGLDKVCERIVSSGCRAPGTILSLCSDEFLELFNSAPLIISKGQGNYETLSGQDDAPYSSRLFYLLKAKCDVVSRHLGVKTGEFILTREKRS